MSQPPLIVHVLYRLDMGGLETLLIDCVNRMPPERYRHAIVCLTEATPFAQNIRRADVTIYALHKAPGWALHTQFAFWKLMRRLRPALLHTYNLAAIEYHLVAALAGVPARLHAEHGRDAADPQGLNRRHNLLRRLVAPLIHAFVPVSLDLHQWLSTVIGVPEAKNLLVANGIDTARFQPGGKVLRFFPEDCFVIGSVGRLNAVKDYRTLIDAFVHLRALLPQHADRLRLVIIGDGPERGTLQDRIAQAGLDEVVYLPGACKDVAPLLRGFSLFALSSIAEGTPISVLEAMASGLPVVATEVGGVPKVVRAGRTGALVPASAPAAMARALAAYCANPDLVAGHGEAACVAARGEHGIDATVAAYLKLYDRLLAPGARSKTGSPACAE